MARRNPGRGRGGARERLTDRHRRQSVRAQRGRRFTCSTSREWSGELRKKGCAGRKLKCWSRLERQLFRGLCPWPPQELVFNCNSLCI
jgi:hypothetical protein